jgi:formylglycine-generating enzyme required for sulfatase activity
MHPELIAFELLGQPVVIGSYGVLLSATIALAACGLLRAAHQAGVELGVAISAAGTAVCAGLAGALVLNAMVAAIERGSFAAPGLSMFGGLLGGGAGLWLAGRAFGFAALPLADRMVPAVALAQAVARLGCFLGGCCFGSEWHGAWTVAAGGTAAELVVERHPVALYEAFALAGLAWLFARGKGAVPAGQRALGFLALYALLRLVLDGLRDAEAGASQLVALAVLVGALFALARSRRSAAMMPRTRTIASVGLLLACFGAAAWTVVGASAQAVLALAPRADDAPLIRAGVFEMGSDADDVDAALVLCRAHTDDDDACQTEVFSDEQPRHRVWLGTYRLDRAEVSRRAYQRCVQAGVCKPPRVTDLDARMALPNHPVSGVTFGEAQRYCAWLGGRLPSEAEWERAARGSDTRRFPWGGHWNSRVANHGSMGPGGVQPDGFLHAAPVMAFPDGKSAYGMLNMAGNVWELTADRYAHDYYARSERVAPRGASEGSERVIRGGSWRSVPHLLRVTQRGALAEHESRPDVGFRCAY